MVLKVLFGVALLLLSNFIKKFQLQVYLLTRLPKHKVTILTCVPVDGLVKIIEELTFSYLKDLVILHLIVCKLLVVAFDSFVATS